MNRKTIVVILMTISLSFVTSQVLASDGGGVGDKAFFFSIVAASCGFGMAIASAGCGLAQGRAIAKAMESIARQPSAFKDIQMLLIIGLALIESLALYTLVVALILIYASPFTDLIAH